MVDLVVYGASGFGQQVMFWVEDANAAEPRFRIRGFVDDDPTTHGGEHTGHAVLGGGDWLRERAKSAPVAVVLGLASPAVKRQLVRELRAPGIDFPSIVHPSAVVSGHAVIERGAVLAPGCVASVNVRLGEFALVNTACTLGHDAQVGAYAALLPGVNVSGGALLGERVTVGTGAALVQGVEIGDGATVGAGATVLASLPAGCTAVGTPARPLSRGGDAGSA
jgi:sugar O-acyltransferase (sialic acid O-acetyltransferase NeuD family)